jgi:sec-independent protein translocase protein TatB
MFGLGGSEIVIIGLLFLLIFGPSKLPQMARDIGRFVGEARRSIDEFKDELTIEPDPDEKPARRRESRNGSKKTSVNRKKAESESTEEEDSETASSETSSSETSKTEKKEETELRDL